MKIFILATLLMSHLTFARSRADQSVYIKPATIEAFGEIPFRTMKLEVFSFSAKASSHRDLRQKKRRAYKLHAEVSLCIDQDSGTKQEYHCSHPLVKTKRFYVESFNYSTRSYYPSSERGEVRFSTLKLYQQAQALLGKVSGGSFYYRIEIFGERIIDGIPFLVKLKHDESYFSTDKHSYNQSFDSYNQTFHRENSRSGYHLNLSPDYDTRCGQECF